VCGLWGYGANIVTLSEETESNREHKPAPNDPKAHIYSTITSSTFSSSYGLRNIHQRLVLEYGEGMGVFIDSSTGHGTTVSIRVAKEVAHVQSSID
jgi:sensor histidine kinase YesM